MRLIEIKGLFDMDSGSPSPVIISNERELNIMFYSDNGEGSILNPQERNTIYNSGIIALKFKQYRHYALGLISNEILHNHRYYKLGLQSYGFYELTNSDTMKSLELIDKDHPYYNPEMWKEYKHYIITFHDSLFECIAKNFELTEEPSSIYHHSSLVLSGLSVREL